MSEQIIEIETKAVGNSGVSDEASGIPIRVPNNHRIRNTDKIRLHETTYGFIPVAEGEKRLKIGDKGDIVDIRYINGCPTPWVAEQKLKGYTPNENNPLADQINIVDGNLRLDMRVGFNKQMWDYLKITNYNEDNEHRDNTIAEAQFKTIDRRGDAIKDIKLVELVDKAVDIINKVRKGEGYDETLMEFYSNVFSTQLEGVESSEEKYVRLRKLASVDPRIIIKLMDDGTAKYHSIINQAFELGILVTKGENIANSELSKVAVKGDGKEMTEAHANDLAIAWYTSKLGADDFKILEKQVSSKIG